MAFIGKRCIQENLITPTPDQVHLMHLSMTMFENFERLIQEGVITDPAKLAALIDVVSSSESSTAVFGGKPWPKSAYPIPDLWVSLTWNLYWSQPDEALKIALRVCFVICRDMHNGTVGERWIATFYFLVKILMRILSSKETVKRADLSKADLDKRWVLARYCSQLEREARDCYGADAAFTTAVKQWMAQSNGLIALTPPHSRAAFDQSQKDLLKWAGIPESDGVHFGAMSWMSERDGVLVMADYF